MSQDCQTSKHDKTKVSKDTGNFFLQFNICAYVLWSKAREWAHKIIVNICFSNCFCPLYSRFIEIWWVYKAQLILFCKKKQKHWKTEKCDSKFNSLVLFYTCITTTLDFRQDKTVCTAKMIFRLVLHFFWWSIWNRGIEKKRVKWSLVVFGSGCWDLRFQSF